ncbi:MAG: hypothetical protein JWQ09_693 [Segetibacter sp.]|nr:hypothetical protein [Segetibacter sp.]
MKKNVIILSLVALSLGSCQKKIDNIVSGITGKGQTTSTKTGEFVKYTIPKGEQYSDKSAYSAVNYQQLSFIVKFDSSAIYQTVSASNQSDINKLFGFSDNKAQHHEYSARFGWRWSNNALRLFGYIYNNSVMSFKELGTVAIGAENTCSIKVNKDTYVFTLNGKETTMPRASTTATAEGYKLYPYFGGDEMAPHTISIWIREL